MSFASSRTNSRHPQPARDLGNRVGAVSPWPFLSARSCEVQILMLKSGRHAVDFRLGESVPRGFVAPLRDHLADLRHYFAGLAGVEIKIPRNLQCQRKRRGVVILVDAVARMRAFMSVGTGLRS